MNARRIKDPGASIRQRLLDHAKKHGVDYQRILHRYAIERLLFRLCQTEARERYILKGAMLFVTWPEHTLRPTGDLDLLGHGDPDPAAITELFTRICQVEAPEDGIVFDAATLRVEAIREDEKYQGVRLNLKGLLAKASISVQVDIGFGDAVYPAPSRKRFPGLLPDLPAPEVLMYPPETVVAEKLEAIISLGEANTRIKDFYDIWVATRTFSFDLATLLEAVSGTLIRRETAAPHGMPLPLTREFADRPSTQALWTGFLRRSPPALQPPPLAQLVEDLQHFFEPVLSILVAPATARTSQWNPHRCIWE